MVEGALGVYGLELGCSVRRTGSGHIARFPAQLVTSNKEGACAILPSVLSVCLHVYVCEHSYSETCGQEGI